MLGKIKYKELSQIYPCLMTEFQMTVQRFKMYKSPGTDQIPAETIQAGSIKLRCDVRTAS
jgi:hypothetical protein